MVQLLTREQIGRIEAFLRRMYKYGFFQSVINFQELPADYGLTLYRTLLCGNSCIHQLLPAKNDGIMQLRPRGHNFALPACKHDLFKDSFVTRCLYKQAMFNRPTYNDSAFIQLF